MIVSSQCWRKDTDSLSLGKPILPIAPDESIWSLTRKNLSLGVCEQQRRRPACASVHTDQCFCYSLIEKYYIKTCYKQNFTILASLCS